MERQTRQCQVWPPRTLDQGAGCCVQTWLAAPTDKEPLDRRRLFLTRVMGWAVDHEGHSPSAHGSFMCAAVCMCVVQWVCMCEYTYAHKYVHVCTVHVCVCYMSVYADGRQAQGRQGVLRVEDQLPSTIGVAV